MNQCKITTIVFDFDGTIADTLTRSIELFNELALKKGYLVIDKIKFKTLRQKRIPEIMNELDVPLKKLPFIAHHVRMRIKAEVEGISPFPGMRELLSTLKKLNYTVGIISSNNVSNIKAFLTAHELDYFDFIFSSKEMFGKHRIIRKLLKKKNIKKEEILYIGDEIRDIEACHKIGVQIAAVSWGFSERSALEKEKPDFIAFTPGDIMVYLNHDN